MIYGYNDKVGTRGGYVISANPRRTMYRAVQTRTIGRGILETRSGSRSRYHSQESRMNRTRGIVHPTIIKFHRSRCFQFLSESRPVFFSDPGITIKQTRKSQNDIGDHLFAEYGLYMCAYGLYGGNGLVRPWKSIYNGVYSKYSSHDRY